MKAEPRAWRPILLSVLPALCLAACAQLTRTPSPSAVLLPDRQELISRAESLISDLDALFQRVFPSTGFADYTEFYGSLQEGGGTAGKELAKMILDENIQIGMHAKEDSRMLIARNGFLNIHSAKTSSFSINAEGRNAIEAGCLGIKPEYYAALPPYLKPKYGFLMPQITSVLEAPDLSRWYGNDVYIIKLNNVRNRLSWTPGDSLDRIDKWSSAKGINWKTGESFSAESWDLLFIPWARRALMIPLLEEDVAATGKLAFTATPLHPLYNMSKAGPGLKTAYPGPNASYVEVQIWGPLDIGDVEKFIFKARLPDGDFLKTLKKLGIPVYDGRNGKPVKWISLRVVFSPVTA